MSDPEDRLYNLLPAVYRQRDAIEGMPLRELLQVIATQVDLVEADIAQLYENWFIETCQDWVVLYIGDAIGYQPVHEAGEPGDIATFEGQQRNRILISRREVANTIRYRRRKGTLALLELLANDVAGWAARAVEFYRLLGWTQHLDRLRLNQGRTVDLRQGNALDLLDTPFNRIAHTVDIHRITSQYEPGYYNLPSVGLFVWRLKVYSVTKTPAYRIDSRAYCYTFSILGNDAPLYTHPQLETDPTHIADEINLPIAIRRRAFAANLAANKNNYYGADRSLQIWAQIPSSSTPIAPNELQPIPGDRVVVADLSNWQYRSNENVAVDPVLGRMVFPSSLWTQKGVWVTYHYGFSADMGGGEYDRPRFEPAAYRLLDEDDLNDPVGFVNKLQHPPESVSSYIQQQLSAETRHRLDDYHPTSDSAEPPLELLTAILTDLNQLIQRESLYTPDRFDWDDLPRQAQILILQNPQGKQLIYLNHLLLETAYPSEIAKYYFVYYVCGGERLNDAIERWRQEKPRHGAIEITHSYLYEEPINIELPKNHSLTLRAANRTRPVLRQLNWNAPFGDAVNISGDTGSSFTLDGLLITGRGVQVTGKLAELTIRHCTLVPGWEIESEDCEPEAKLKPSLYLENVPTRVAIEHSIVGSIQVEQNQVTTDPISIYISDSILDATATDMEALDASLAPVAHVALTVTRSTILGRVQVHAIPLAENSIFMGEVLVARRQVGCMRFCYVPLCSRTPRRYNCQPDLVRQAVTEDLRTVESDRVRPQFNSIRYGNPTYCQLSHACAMEIKRGADDESEMGAFHDLFQPQRAANLRTRLDEYTPAGMETGIIYGS